MESADLELVCAWAAVDLCSHNANTVALASKIKLRGDGRSRFNVLLASLGTISRLRHSSLGLNNVEHFPASTMIA